jgi:hypothetical protein
MTQRAIEVALQQKQGDGHFHIGWEPSGSQNQRPKKGNTMRSLRNSAVAAAALLALPLAAIAQQSPPGPANTIFTVPANSAYWACEFDLQIQLLGKGGWLTLPGGRFISISTSPGLKATLTNLQNGNAATFNVTGSSRQSIDAYGNNVYNWTGRNLMGDPTTGLVLAIGDYSYTFDSSGQTLLKPLSGTGRMINACQLVQ